MNQSKISALYISIFGRASEGSGNKYWQNLALKYNLNYYELANYMLETQPAKEFFGAKMNDNKSFVEHIYKTTLNKNPNQDIDGINFWTNNLNKGVNKGTLVSEILKAALDTKYANSPDATTKEAHNLLINKIVASNTTADMVQNLPNGNNLQEQLKPFVGIANSIKANFTAQDIKNVINDTKISSLDSNINIDAVLASNSKDKISKEILEGNSQTDSNNPIINDTPTEEYYHYSSNGYKFYISYMTPDGPEPTQVVRQYSKDYEQFLENVLKEAENKINYGEDKAFIQRGKDLYVFLDDDSNMKVSLGDVLLKFPNKTEADIRSLPQDDVAFDFVKAYSETIDTIAPEVIAPIHKFVSNTRFNSDKIYFTQGKYKDVNLLDLKDAGISTSKSFIDTRMQSQYSNEQKNFLVQTLKELSSKITVHDISIFETPYKYIGQSLVQKNNDSYYLLDFDGSGSVTDNDILIKFANTPISSLVSRDFFYETKPNGYYSSIQHILTNDFITIENKIDALNNLLGQGNVEADFIHF